MKPKLSSYLDNERNLEAILRAAQPIASKKARTLAVLSAHAAQQEAAQNGTEYQGPKNPGSLDSLLQNQAAAEPAQKLETFTDKQLVDGRSDSLEATTALE
ncbi:hypothetical protein BIW11_07099 [Tropilaelaps mercedesae]|uniref:Uncharacterized protein n=1 Tax=Tropilaelaps mercedesae TaxID=418985 RepID=A0A1V9XVQ8_9ACAR|nr:hypothetical protein BIW11_07099 [Tropilaelaps mercedesae]